MTSMALISGNLGAQDTICATHVPESYLPGYLNETDSVAAFSASGFRRTSNIVPVRVTNFVGGGGVNLSQADVDMAISELNQVYAPAGLTFEQCGNLNVVNDERIKSSDDLDQFVSSFSYASGTLEIYVKPSGVPPIGFIPPPSYYSGNPNYNHSILQHDNIVKLNSGLGGSIFIHETGHHFGLLHTHFRPWTYQYPTVPTQLDFPTVVANQSGNGPHPDWWGRELVIRDEDNDPFSTRDFKLPNKNTAGDLVGDTPADCDFQSPSNFPGCLISAQQADCSFDNTMTYVDYNQDAINPPPAGLLLGRNYMSYWKVNCLNEFTPKQYERISFYFDNYRNLHYKPDLCDNFTDRVEFEGSSLGLHNVTLRTRHLTTTQKCNVTSSVQGDYSGVLYDPQLRAYAYHNGKSASLAYASDPLRMHFDHICSEWVRGVTTLDLMAISQHILGTQPLPSGYSMIAADANKSNSITTYDIIELRRLILGIYDKLPAFDQPWRFIPEFIPQNHTSQFNTMPFNMDINGQFVGADYLEQGWLFEFPGTAIGQKGFDGIKIGDVNSSWPTDAETPCDPNQNETPAIPDLAFNVPSSSLNAGDTVVLRITTENFIDQNAFQFGIHLPYENFELLEVAPGSLPEYSAEENFGLTKLESDVLRTLWFSPTGAPVTLSNGATVFSLLVRVKSSVSDLSTLIFADDHILDNNIWRTTESTSTAAAALTLQIEPFTGERTASGESHLVKAFDCIPNPSEGVFLMRFKHNEQATSGDLLIRDLAGRIIYQNNLQIETGEHYFRVDQLASEPAGVYWVSFSVNGNTYTEKIVKQ